MPESSLPHRLEEIKEAIRREIRKELKVFLYIIMAIHLSFMGFVHHACLSPSLYLSLYESIRSYNTSIPQIKEGAEKLREVTTDRRSLSDVASIVKKSNSKLAELKSELHELESQILLTKGNTIDNGQGELTQKLFHYFTNRFQSFFSSEYRTNRK